MTVEAASGGVKRVLQRRGVRQFVKFCIVGASSTLIDFTVYLSLMEGLRLQAFVGVVLARILAATSAFGVAVTNGFFWNNHWTFRGSTAGSVPGRYARFILTNVIGLCLNVTILTIVSQVVPAALVRLLDPYLHDPAGLVGKVSATAVVVFWNFTASKYWTFRR